MSSKECKYAIFNYNESEEQLISECAKYLDSMAPEICSFFQVFPQEKATINIIQTKKQFDDEYRKQLNLDEDYQVAKWVIGFVPKNKQIFMLSIGDYKNTSHAFSPEQAVKMTEYFKKTIVHEFVHFVHDQFNKAHGCCNKTTWLAEGLATYLSHQHDGEELRSFPSKEQVLQGHSYVQFNYLVKFLIENYNKDVLFSMLENGAYMRAFFENELYDKAKSFYGKTGNKVV